MGSVCLCHRGQLKKAPLLAVSDKTYSKDVDVQKRPDLPAEWNPKCRSLEGFMNNYLQA